MQIVKLRSLSAREENNPDDFRIENTEVWDQLPANIQNAIRQNWQDMQQLYETIAKLSSGKVDEGKERILSLVSQVMNQNSLPIRERPSRKPPYKQRT